MSRHVRSRSKSKQRDDLESNQQAAPVVVSTSIFDVFINQKFIFLKILLNYYGYSDKFPHTDEGKATLIKKNSILASPVEIHPMAFFHAYQQQNTHIHLSIV